MIQQYHKSQHIQAAHNTHKKGVRFNDGNGNNNAAATAVVDDTIKIMIIIIKTMMARWR